MFSVRNFQEFIPFYVYMSINPYLYFYEHKACNASKSSRCKSYLFLVQFQLDTFKTYSLFCKVRQEKKIFELKSSTFRSRQCNYAKILPKKFTKICVSTAAVRPRSLAYYPCFPVYGSNNFVPEEGVGLNDKTTSNMFLEIESQKTVNVLSSLTYD